MTTAKQWATMTEEQRAAKREYERSRRATMTEEQRAAEREYRRAWHAANAERQAERKRQQWASMTDEQRAAESERSRQWRADNAGRVRQYRADNRARRIQQRRQWALDNPERAAQLKREAAARSATRDRAAVFAHYGQVCACPGCGATERLTIDHIDGNGREHRQEIFGRQGSGIEFYRWLIKNGFPSGYQTLCLPCNSSKQAKVTCQRDHSKAALPA